MPHCTYFTHIRGQPEAPSSSWELGHPTAPGTRKPGQSAHAETTTHTAQRGILMPRGGNCRETIIAAHLPRNCSRAAKRGGFKRGGFPISTGPSFFVLFWDFPDFSGIFPICAGMVRGFARFVLFLFLSLSEHLRGTVPKGSATQSGPFPKKVGNTRVWKHPGLACLKLPSPRGQF